MAMTYNILFCVYKGLDVEEGRLQLISEVIKSCLGVDCAVLMGANIASDVAKQQFCEATIGWWSVTVVCD